MKMVCKKLLSLVLVALMLVSAVPFQASATVAGAGRTVYVFYNDTEYVTAVLENGKITEGDYAAIQEKLGDREVTGWYIDGGDGSTFWLKGKEFSEEEFGEFTGLNIKPVFKEVTPPAPEHTEHTWDKGTVTKAATCAETGEMTYHCTYPGCTGTKTAPIPMVDHTYKVEEVPATCGKDGTRTKICTVCGAKETETIKATGNHTWNDGEVLVEATATTEGTKLYTCRVCGATKTEKYGANVKEIVFQVTVNGSSTSTKKGFVINKTMELPTPSVPAGYKFKGWFSESNGKGTQLANGTTCTENLANVYYAYFTEDVKFDYNVYLNIYADNKVDEPAKRITITNGIAKDGKVTLAEVKDVVFDYYTAKDSNGITFDGLYMATGNWVDKFNKNDKFDTVDVSDLKEQDNVFVNVMITNAKVKSSSNSNSSSSNPKTGDTIFMAVTVMGLSAASLAAVYYVSKKRAVR